MLDKIEKSVESIANLKFDIYNPRLPKRLQGITNDSEIIDYMVKNGNILELMKSISELGYSAAEPVLVVLDEKDKKYIVVEGNRRLTAVKLLNNPGLAKERKSSIAKIIEEAINIPTEIPVIKYSSRNDILDYLGYRHITGVKEWGALEKAQYLDQLYKMHCTDANKSNIYIKLAKMIGSRADYVQKLHLALKLYNIANDEAYFGGEVQEKDIKFSWITTALGYKEIIEFVHITDDMNEINMENYEKLFLWMFDKTKHVIGDSREIGKLAKVVVQEKAIEKLQVGGTIEEAYLYTSMPSEIFIETLKIARKSLKQAKDEIEQLSEEPSEARDILEEMAKIIKSIIGALDSNFSNETELLKSLSKEQLRALMEVIKSSEEGK